MLSAMFSGIFKSKKDSNGRFFIDRDGKFFRYILNYLRDGCVDLMTDEQQRKQLLKEAQFYQIQGLIACIEEALESSKVKDQQAKSGQYAIVVRILSYIMHIHLEILYCTVLYYTVRCEQHKDLHLNGHSTENLNIS
jgi:hypothetical protein